MCLSLQNTSSVGEYKGNSTGQMTKEEPLPHKGTPTITCMDVVLCWLDNWYYYYAVTVQEATSDTEPGIYHSYCLMVCVMPYVHVIMWLTSHAW